MWSSRETLVAQHVKGINLDYGEDITSLSDLGKFSIQNTANGDIVVILGDDEFTFTSEHTDCEWCNDGRNFYYEERDSDDKLIKDRGLALISSNTFSDLGTREQHFATFYTNFTDDSEGRRAYAIVGNSTTDFADLNDMTATYGGEEGFARLEFNSAEGYDRAQNSRQSYHGDSEFTADFGNSTISGRLYNFRKVGTNEIAGLGFNPENFVATLPATSFDQNGFKADLQISGLESDQNISASSEGSFFGPGAASVAGTISGVYDTSDHTNSTIVGWFGSGKNE